MITESLWEINKESFDIRMWNLAGR